MIYYSVSQVAKYVAIGDSYKAKSERRFLRIIGKLKIMVILMICNDLLFSSIRNLLHYNLKTFNEKNMSIQYYIISIITVCFICYDFISITMNISNNQILEKIDKNTRVITMLNSYKPKYEKDLREGKINEDGTPKRDKYDLIEEDRRKMLEERNEIKKKNKFKKRLQKRKNMNSSSFVALNDGTLGVIREEAEREESELFEEEVKDIEKLEENFTSYKELEKDFQFSADFEFCAKGIKPNKLVKVKKSRYFNIILTIKVSLFEAVIISNQQIPVVQASLLFLIQGIFITYMGICVFKDKIFKDSFSSHKRALFEVLLTIYYFVCMLQGWCQAGVNSLCTPVFVRRVLFFSILTVMLILMLSFFVYALYCAYLRIYYPKLIDMKNRILMPEEKVKIRWVDDSTFHGKKFLNFKNFKL